jgi:hypothetical protein
MGNTERALKQAAMIADVYSRAMAAAISCNDPGILPEAEAKKAVVGFIRMMKALDNAYWYGYDEEAF